MVDDELPEVPVPAPLVVPLVAVAVTSPVEPVVPPVEEVDPLAEEVAPVLGLVVVAESVLVVPTESLDEVPGSTQVPAMHARPTSHAPPAVHAQPTVPTGHPAESVSESVAIPAPPLPQDPDAVPTNPHTTIHTSRFIEAAETNRLSAATVARNEA